jgi:hypothetical protein
LGGKLNCFAFQFRRILMLKKLSARGRVSFATLAIVLLAVIALVAFIPGVLLSAKIITTAYVSEVLFRLEGNTGIVWDALGSKGPGYANLEVLA